MLELPRRRFLQCLVGLVAAIDVSSALPTHERS
jgi:hypothetical protein